jgi:tripartite-type tricarboxylate transporter receptor subunit TctC
MLGSIASLLISPALYANVGYDPVNSFSPISVIGVTSFALVVNPKLSARSVKELIDLAKAQPGKLNYGSSTLGTPPHLMAEMFKTQAGADIFGINYKGSADAVTALLSGDVQVMVDQFAALLPLIASGKVRPLMVMSAKRVKQLSDVPSAPEVGLPGLAVESWFGVLGPKGMPPEVVKRLHAEMVKAIASKELVDMLGRQGLEPLSNTPEEYAAMIKADAPKWAAAVKASGAKVQ